ncbi:MAG: class I SAM-dependent methyltransferase [Bacteroidota bacterium]|nr:class I SAM-dependent methyltransferase [Bacteroidota bacterium]
MILEVGCGTARRTIELAGGGYLMTGFDISSGILSVTECAAAAAGLSVTRN